MGKSREVLEHYIIFPYNIGVLLILLFWVELKDFCTAWVCFLSWMICSAYLYLPRTSSYKSIRQSHDNNMVKVLYISISFYTNIIVFACYMYRYIYSFCDPSKFDCTLWVAKDFLISNFHSFSFLCSTALDHEETASVVLCWIRAPKHVYLCPT